RLPACGNHASLPAHDWASSAFPGRALRLLVLRIHGCRPAIAGAHLVLAVLDRVVPGLIEVLRGLGLLVLVAHARLLVCLTRRGSRRACLLHPSWSRGPRLARPP